MFHVDKMSSVHVYVRLHKGQTIDDISEGLLEDCAQLVKEFHLIIFLEDGNVQPAPSNTLLQFREDSFVTSLGNKVNNIDVVHTPWQI
ncbi:unnamed protein product [Camellia sinensis]